MWGKLKDKALYCELYVITQDLLQALEESELSPDKDTDRAKVSEFIDGLIKYFPVEVHFSLSGYESSIMISEDGSVGLTKVGPKKIRVYQLNEVTDTDLSNIDYIIQRLEHQREALKHSIIEGDRAIVQNHPIDELFEPDQDLECEIRLRNKNLHALVDAQRKVKDELEGEIKTYGIGKSVLSLMYNLMTSGKTTMDEVFIQSLAKSDLRFRDAKILSELALVIENNQNTIEVDNEVRLAAKRQGMLVPNANREPFSFNQLHKLFYGLIYHGFSNNYSIETKLDTQENLDYYVNTLIDFADFVAANLHGGDLQVQVVNYHRRLKDIKKKLDKGKFEVDTSHRGFMGRYDLQAHILASYLTIMPRPHSWKTYS